SVENAIAAMKRGAFDYITKPFKNDEVLVVLRNALKQRRLVAENRALRQNLQARANSFGEIIGRSSRMRQVFDLIIQAAPSRTTILIDGESGTGKELVARSLHQNSSRSDRAFITVNSGNLPPDLLESNLFGHVKGAFTGAVGARKGYFELAGKGTIFLDEIGDTSPELQTKLLRVVQERSFYPVGGETPRTTEARIIAATHQPMEELVAVGRFREDLYFRLKVVEIRVPSLRERPDDISALASALLGRIREETGRDVRRISDEALRRLRAHPWPGNVRELENALLRAALLARGTVIGPDHLTLGTEAAAGEDLTLASAVLRHVRRVLERTAGDEADAAKLLGISKKELKQHLVDLGVPSS
ncbi:MAG: sigma-54 dependent transcriptional regulator, partial [Longimicrobiales bacterium]|nr:sigma-54 dependent transcriptional regulator [Longimicrobiales bacterium]